MIDKFLNYQKTDTEIFKLEKEFKGNENKKQANLMIKFVKDAGEKIKKLNDEAGKLSLELKKLEEVKDRGFSVVENYVKQEIKDLKEEELKELKDKTARARNNLREIEKRLKTQAEKNKKLLTEFETTKKKVMLARQKHKENKEAYDKFVAENNPKLVKLQKSLKALEKDLDKKLLEKYNTLRKDGIFPVIVPLNNNACGGCGMGLPSSTLGKIKEQGYLQCEQCRRIIYFK